MRLPEIMAVPCWSSWKTGIFHGLLQRFLNIETFRGFYVFQIDATESGLQQLADFDDLVGIVGVKFKVEDIHVGKTLEEDGFAFHTGFAGEGADARPTEEPAVPLVTTATRLPRAVYLKASWRILALDGQARLGYSRGVGQA